jgi:hypothetical protein
MIQRKPLASPPRDGGSTFHSDEPQQWDEPPSHSPLRVRSPPGRAAAAAAGAAAGAPADERCPGCRTAALLLLGIVLGCGLTLRFAVPGASCGGPASGASGAPWALPKHLETARVALGGAPVAPSRPTVVLFGDSMAAKAYDAEEGQSWAGGIQSWYGAKADVISRGLPGYNTRWAAARLAQLFPPSTVPPALVIVCFGANDAAVRKLDPSQHVPVPEFKANLRKIVDHLNRLSDSTLVLVLTPPPVDEEALGQALRGGARRCGVETYIAVVFADDI